MLGEARNNLRYQASKGIVEWYKNKFAEKNGDLQRFYFVQAQIDKFIDSIHWSFDKQYRMDCGCIIKNSPFHYRDRSDMELNYLRRYVGELYKQGKLSKFEGSRFTTDQLNDMHKLFLSVFSGIVKEDKLVNLWNLEAIEKINWDISIDALKELVGSLPPLFFTIWKEGGLLDLFARKNGRTLAGMRKTLSTRQLHCFRWLHENFMALNVQSIAQGYYHFDGDESMHSFCKEIVTSFKNLETLLEEEFWHECKKIMDGLSSYKDKLNNNKPVLMRDCNSPDFQAVAFGLNVCPLGKRKRE